MSNKFYSVSRVEEEKAVVEFPDETFHEVPFSLLPDDVKEGNILVPDDEGNLIHDYKTENERKEKLLSLQDDIFG